LYDARLAVERIAAARGAIDSAGSRVLLTARCEAFLAGPPDLAVTVDRLIAYADAGADCLYTPSIRSLDQITELVHRPPTTDHRPATTNRPPYILVTTALNGGKART
jgi:2-methylisocitrate lyase-like PEP mutase family enzyme